MFAHARESVVPGIWQDISAPKTMITIFFTFRPLVVLEALPKWTKFNQDYIIQSIFPPLYREKTRISPRTGFPAFSVQMNNLMCQNDRTILRSLPREALNDPHTHFIRQTSVRATFGCLAFSSTT
jgi:hypothetical protein